MNFELFKTFTVLYVEDEKFLQDSIYQNLSPFVKEIIVANDGKEGLDLFNERKDDIDLVISDILMPHMNGIEMIDEIRKMDKDVPIIYTTAFNDSEYMKRTIEQSVVSYIIKPIDIELLLEGIGKASLKIENEKLKNYLQNINKDLEKTVELKTKELQTKNDELYQQLYTDELTKLPNRKALFRDKKLMNKPLLFLIDIDSFKSINDLYGEEVGNKVLKDIACLLKDFSQKNDFKCFRMGADEFAVLKDASLEEGQILQTIKNIQTEINSHPLLFEKYNIKVRIDATIGVSADKPDTYKKATMALKKAKKETLAYLIYSEEHNLNVEHENDIKWTRIIENAINTDNVVPYYQPIVDKDEKIIRYESLMRIIDNDKVCAPFFFLDIAKKVKFYTKLEQMIIKKSLKKAKQSNSIISINVSIEDILNNDFIDFIEEEIKKENVAGLITFELLESQNITDYEKVIYFINRVKKLGCRIAIDDFGSGYSNFTYLLRLKPDFIKIDGSSVKNMHKDENAYLIVKTINDFAHNLGIKTVAEFVHCKEVFEMLKDLNVDLFQGYYFSEPKEEL